MRTFCITGATGFIGRHLVKQLKDRERGQIYALTRDPANLSSLLHESEVVQGDLLVPESLVRFLKPGATVINLAYLSRASRETNLRAMEILAEACTVAEVGHLIHCSTAVVAGNAPDNTILETTTCVPWSLYERTKLDMEDLLREKLDGKCSISILRPTAVFGEGGKNLVKLVDEIIAQPRLINVLRSSLYGKRRLNLVFVDNVIAALLFLAQDPKDTANEVFIISDDESPRNNYQDLAQLICDVFMRDRVPRIPIPLNLELLSVISRLVGKTNTRPMRVYSCEKILQSGFVKPVPFVDGARRFLSWYRQEMSHLPTSGG